jgi:methylglutaconyl-CoA hydratase
VCTLNDATQFFSGFANVLNAMRTCSKIIIGRVHGKAVGGGVGIIAACDYAMATTAGDIKLSELALGIGPFVIEPAICRKIGKSAMAELSLETAWKTATWANQKGLYVKIVETIVELDLEILAFANKLKSYSPDALFEMKKVFWSGTENWSSLLYERAEISAKLVLSDFSKNALLNLKK